MIMQMIQIWSNKNMIQIWIRKNMIQIWINSGAECLDFELVSEGI